MHRKNLPFLAGLIPLLAGPVASADFIIPEWVLGVSVAPPGSGNNNSHILTTVQNPFEGHHSAAVGLSTAEAWYDFSRADDSGSFLIEAALQAEGIPSSVLHSFSSGGFLITPTEDLSLNIQAAYSYVLGSDPMEARLKTNIYATDPYTSLFFASEQAL